MKVWEGLRSLCKKPIAAPKLWEEGLEWLRIIHDMCDMFEIWLIIGQQVIYDSLNLKPRIVYIF